MAAVALAEQRTAELLADRESEHGGFAYWWRPGDVGHSGNVGPGCAGVAQPLCFQPMMQPNEMKQCFIDQGLREVKEIQLPIRMDYESFADYWDPIAAGEGPLGKYVAGLASPLRARTDAAVREAYEAGRQTDGLSCRSHGHVARWLLNAAVGQHALEHAFYLFKRQLQFRKLRFPR